MKNLKNTVAALVAVILFSAAANAQTINTIANEPLLVKYIGNEEGYLYFQVEIKDAGSKFALLKINDKAEGEELYSQNLNGTPKAQIFKIEKKEGQELNFKLLSGNKVYSKTFSANTSFKETTTVSEKDVVVL